MSPAIRAQVEAALQGAMPAFEPALPPSGPVVMAPVQIDGALQGLVVLPPPPRRGPFSEVGRLLSLPGTIVLLMATALVGAVLLRARAPRLRALERAAERIGAGDLAVRADDAGGDEMRGIGRRPSTGCRASCRPHRGSCTASDRRAPTDACRRLPRAAHAAHRDARLPRHAGACPTCQLDADTRARYLETARREAGRLERIVADLLDLARHEHGASALDAAGVRHRAGLRARGAAARAGGARRRRDDHAQRRRGCRPGAGRSRTGWSR